MALPTTYKYQCGGDCGYGSDNADDFAMCMKCYEEQGADAPLLCHENCLREHGWHLCDRHFKESGLINGGQGRTARSVSDATWVLATLAGCFVAFLATKFVYAYLKGL